MELGEPSQSSMSSQIDSQEKMNTSQTDESKVAEQQTSARAHQTSKPRVPCVADTGNKNNYNCTNNLKYKLQIQSQIL